jgi:hypothetical protein
LCGKVQGIGRSGTLVNVGFVTWRVDIYSKSDVFVEDGSYVGFQNSNWFRWLKFDARI